MTNNSLVPYVPQGRRSFLNQYGPTIAKWLGQEMRKNLPKLLENRAQSVPSLPKPKPKAAPVAVSQRLVAAKAQTRQTKNSVIVSHRELISSSVLGSTSFYNAGEFRLNPGDSTTFPWLSTQAAQYEMYRFRKLVFEYVPFVSTSTAGDVLIVPEYDSTSPAPSSEQAAYDHLGAVIDSCWQSIACKLNPGDLHALGPRKYVRQGNVLGDRKTFDSGTLYVFTNNQSGSSAIGKLFVTYEVEFFTPIKISNPVSLGTTYYSLSVSQTFATTVFEAIEWRTTETDPLGITKSPDFLTLTLPRGTYFVQGSVTFSSNATSFNEVWINRNGGAQNTTMTSTLPAGGTCCIPFYGVIVSDGTDSIQIMARMTGAGTCVIPAYGANLLITNA